MHGKICILYQEKKFSTDKKNQNKNPNQYKRLLMNLKSAGQYLTDKCCLLLRWHWRTRGRRKAGWRADTTCCSGGWSRWLQWESAGSCRWPAALRPTLSPLQLLQVRETTKRGTELSSDNAASLSAVPLGGNGEAIKHSSETYIEH